MILHSCNHVVKASKQLMIVFIVHIQNILLLSLEFYIIALTFSLNVNIDVQFLLYSLQKNLILVFKCQYTFTFICSSIIQSLNVYLQLLAKVVEFFFNFFIKCMQPMTMTLSRRCMYAKLHVIWSKSLLYIFSLINHIDSLRIQALSLNSRHRTSVFLCPFAPFAFYSSVPNSHFLVAIQVFFKYSSVAILPILVMNSVNIVSVFLSWAFSLSFICSAL